MLGRAPGKNVIIHPGGLITIKLLNTVPDGQSVVIEPRVDTKTFQKYQWPTPVLTKVISNEIVIQNDSKDFITVRKNEHICQVRPTYECDSSNQAPSQAPPIRSVTTEVLFKLHEISIDPNNQLSEEWKDKFIQLHESRKDVFADKIGRYNDSSGKVRARVNIGTAKPPTRKVNIPNYCPKSMQELQDMFDKLEGHVFARPEDVNVVVEHVSPSFLVKKSSGVGHRLVTAFAAIGEYCKTLPTVMPTVDSTLRVIAAWRYIIKTDLRDAFYQIPLDEDSRKWCATPTPFRGLRCYLVASQGMPGSSETLEELLTTVFGHLIQRGVLAKIADDLYVGGQTVLDTFNTWSEVLDLLILNGLTLKAIKTILFPSDTQILGWNWSNGTISASEHKICPLISCEEPKTVTELRSFIGAYKFFNRLVKGCARYLSSLESAITGKQKKEQIVWNLELSNSFKEAQRALEKASHVTLPRMEDLLIVVHDGSQVGIGSILYLKRVSQMFLGGFFSAKLKAHQAKWLPCEIEALSIAASISHFGPYIRQSIQRTQVLTDNKPCVQAWSKMLRGKFSSSSRVATFMAVLSEYNVELQHISGSVNLPSDYMSRNPPECTDSDCQICKFVSESDDVVVKAVTVEGILSGREKVPYTNKQTWLALQKECPDLRRVHSYIRSGVRPNSKNNRITDVKRYMQKATVSRDGLLVVVVNEPFLPQRQLIVIPQSVLSGLILSLHLSLNHPTINQMIKVFNRDYFALRSAPAIKLITENCVTCESLKKLPKEIQTQASTDYPLSPATSFAADVIRRFRQKLFLLRDTFSSYTITRIIPNEDHVTLKAVLVETISSIRPGPRNPVVVRIDNAPGLIALKNDADLGRLSITLDFGRVHNKNKNPVADKGIVELISELLRFCPEGGSVNEPELAHVTNVLNSRIRDRGLSAWEILFQRDIDSLKQLDFHDGDLAQAQVDHRVEKQGAVHKSSNKKTAKAADVHPGSLVYIKEDGDKTRSRERYLVTKVDGNMCTLLKLNKSKLQKKEYALKVTEVFPVKPTIDVSYANDRGLDDISDEELDTPTPVSQPSELPIDINDTQDQAILQDTGLNTFDDSVGDPAIESLPTQNVLSSSETSDNIVDLSSSSDQEQVDAEEQIPPQRSSRKKRPPVWSKDYDFS